MREIKFSLSEGRYVSDTFAATGTSMAVRVEFEKAGSCTLMKSIDTGKFVPSAALLGYADDVKVVEKTILGVVPAQNFYIDFNAKAVPAKIYVLDGPSGGGGGEDVEALKALITQQGEKIDGISSAIGRQDTVLASHTGKLDSNGQKADEIAGKVEDVKGGMDAQAVTLGEVKSALASLEGKIQENDLESASLFLEVQTTTVTNQDGSTDAVPSNRHIRIVDDDLKCYTIAEWNAIAVAAQFDKAKMPKPVGFSIECNGQKAVLYWPYTGQTYDVTGTVAEPSGQMRLSIYDYDQITAAASGNDTGEAANDGSIGSYHSRAWSVEEQSGNLVLKCGNTGQQWTMAKGCGNASAMIADNSKERTHALYVQNEWMRHRFAVCSGIATDSADGGHERHRRQFGKQAPARARGERGGSRCRRRILVHPHPLHKQSGAECERKKHYRLPYRLLCQRGGHKKEQCRGFYTERKDFISILDKQEHNIRINFVPSQQGGKE